MRRLRHALALLAIAPLPALLPGAPSLPAPPVPSPTPPLPIVSPPTTAPAYLGAPASLRPVRGVPATPRNPFMAANGASEIHNDAWQTDAYPWAGPLGRAPVTAGANLGRDCASIAFDRRGRIISVCVGASGPELFMLDPQTLATDATFALPPRQKVPSNLFQDFTGGGYFYLDAHDRVVTATTTHHLWTIAETPAGDGFTLTRDVDLSRVLTSAEDITSALPDSRGLLWFVTKTDGVVGTVSPRTGVVHTVRLGNGASNEIENSFATGMHGDVYIATNRKLLRFTADRAGRPHAVWSVTYPNSGQHKPGQVDDGTGTTPTVMPGGFVNITDNADPMDVVVYRTAPRLRRGQRRLVCRVPVFAKGASATENSLIGAGRTMIVENNYGYTGPSSVNAGGSTAPGFARVDLDRSGRGCRRVWTNRTLAAPTVVPKLSLRTGLVLAYTKPRDPADPWYWSAIDVHSGRTVWQRLAGTGSLAYNNNYAGVAIARTGTAYLGVLDGIIALRDS